MNKFIHQTSCAYLVIIILIRMMAMPISLLDYSLNQNYITINLCENRFNLAMNCSGKCFLRKQLAKSNENQGTRDQKGMARNVINDFFQTIEQTSFDCRETLSVKYGQYMFARLTDRYLDRIFHPPIV
jgi:hypothetical protein